MGFSGCGPQAPELSSCGTGLFGMWDLSSLIKPCPLHWMTDSQPLDQQGSPNTVFSFNVGEGVVKYGPHISSTNHLEGNLTICNKGL